MILRSVVLLSIVFIAITCSVVYGADSSYSVIPIQERGPLDATLQREGTNAKVINADEIITKIVAGESVNYNNIAIVGDLNLSDVYWSGKAEGNIKIMNSTIEGELDFGGIRFENPVDFSSTIFVKPADFSGAKFEEGAYFQYARFNKYANFGNAQFNDDAYFQFTWFYANSYFQWVRFYEGAEFQNAQFHSYALFENSQFNENANFKKGVFEGNAFFGGTQFECFTDFRKSQFNKYAYFRDAQFSNSAAFTDTQFIGNNDFIGARFSEVADFEKTQFSKDANFEKVQFDGTVNFRGTYFNEDVDLTEAQFGGNVDFNEALFNKNSKIKLYDAKFDRFYVDWDSIRDKIVYDGTAYLSLIRNYRNLDRFDEANECYYDYRYESLGQGPLDYLEWIFYGFGVKPFRPLGCSILIIVGFGLLFRRWNCLSKFDRLVIFEKYASDTSEIKTILVEEKNKFIDPFLFSLAIFTFGATSFLYPSKEFIMVKKYESLTIIERLLGSIFITLILAAIAKTYLIR